MNDPFINLEFNAIQSTDVLAMLTDLQVLKLGYNQILNINALAGLTNLQTLWLTSNQIQSIDALSGMTQLSRLDLSLNRIQSIEPLLNNLGIGQGNSIDLRDNPLDAASCGEDIPQLIYQRDYCVPLLPMTEYL